MFDNEFTLVRQGGDGWEGSVEVVGFIRYRNTIEIPIDESWIVQGTVRISLLRLFPTSHSKVSKRGRCTG